MERIVEDDDGGPARGRARDLHRVLVRLRAGVDEDRLLLRPGTGRELGEQAAGLDVRLVDADHEALMEERVRLAMDRVDDRREPMARVLTPDPTREVDEGAAVGIRDASTLGRGHDEPRSRDPARDVALPVGEDPRPDALFDRSHAREYFT